MPLVVYEKRVPLLEPIKTPPKKIKLHPLPLVTSLAGLIMVASVVWPVMSYELANNKYQPATTSSGLLIPIIENSPQVLAESAISPKVIGDTDYTKASNWFPSAQIINPPLKTISSYYLTIEKLNLIKVLVQVDGDDLTKGLVHYSGTSLPGNYGSAVIFGHSILPQFFNPKNMMSIFSLLPNLKEGDPILIEADNISYNYTVIDKEEVFPTDLSPLEQQYNVQQIKLITCVPPGLKTRRLVVTASLTK